MNKAKRILSILIVLVLCMCTASPAFASSPSKYIGTLPSTAAYSSSQGFLDIMDSNEIIYTYYGPDSDDDDWIEIKYTGDYCDCIDIDAYFSSSEDCASFRFWNVIDFDSADYREVLVVVNRLNAQYKWVKFVVDTSDYSVTAELDVLFPIGNSGEICLESLNQIVGISDRGYHELEPYIKK